MSQPPSKENGITTTIANLPDTTTARTQPPTHPLIPPSPLPLSPKMQHTQRYEVQVSDSANLA
ncbi:hypothetical protein E2C01_081234 [Portunus trituberculatus]|uniref:Uncharacterized protein n=1 Tax=Portunus trituberculatus TaxID=210409 RepID=A0A5B7J0J6_PORTR|nr:hypothetical protein [Portunus trituberculatus]